MAAINPDTQADKNQIIDRLKKHLSSNRIESPLCPDILSANLNPVKQAKIAEYFTGIIRIIGLDLDDESIKGTPERMAKLYTEAFRGLNYSNFPDITMFPFSNPSRSMIKCEDITVNSWCEHHFLPITGTAKVAYIPNNDTGIFGLSKINRIVDFFASRPCTQERLTEQVFETMKFFSETDDIAVRIKARHGCVSCRGITDTSAQTTTSRYGGDFRENILTQNEFLTN